MNLPSDSSRATKLLIVASFFAVYIIWGSTYLSIRLALESLPPFFMTGVRYFVAGLMLYSWIRIRGGIKPNAGDWLQATLSGFLLLVVATLGVVLAERTVPTGLVSLLVAMVPIYTGLLEWLRPGGIKPGKRTALGFAVGFAGMLMLIGPGNLMGGNHQVIDTFGIVAVTIGSLSWSCGMLYARTTRLAGSPLLSTSMQMITAGTIILLMSSGLGELTKIQYSSVTTTSLLSLAYLILFGSIVAYSAFGYLLKTVSPAQLSTFAYINPIVAIFLGWALIGEKVTGQTIIATSIILCAVWLISGRSSNRVGPVTNEETSATTKIDQQSALPDEQLSFR